MNRNARITLAVAASAALVLGGMLGIAANAVTTPIYVDSGPVNTWNDLGLSVSNSEPIAVDGIGVIQDFTPTTSGDLASITVAGVVSSATMHVDISDGDDYSAPSNGDQPTLGPSLATATATPTDLPYAFTTATLPFDKAPHLIAGHQYVLAFSRTTDTGVDPSASSAVLTLSTDVADGSPGNPAVPQADETSNTTVGPWYGLSGYRLRFSVGVTPSVSAVVTPAAPDGTNGWYKTAPSVTYSCDDAWTADNDCPTGIPAVADGVTDLSGDGSVDGADYPWAVHELDIDTTPPTISGQVMTPIGTGGVYDSAITVDWTCSDATSGLATACPSPTTITGVGSDTVASAQIADNAGNVSTATVTGLVRRGGAPRITIHGVTAGHTYKPGTKITPTCTAVSTLGGSVKCAGEITKKVTAKATHNLTYTWTCTAADPRGTTAQKTVTWTVSGRTTIKVSGLPKARRSHQPVVSTKGIQLGVRLLNATGHHVAGRPVFLKAVRTNATGSGATPTAHGAKLVSDGHGGWKLELHFTKSQRHHFWTFGIEAPNGTVRDVTVYVS